MTPSEARDQITKAEMRRAMYKWLWDQTHQAYGKIPAQPSPYLSDEEIERRLDEVMGLTGLLDKIEGLFLHIIAGFLIFAALVWDTAAVEGVGGLALLGAGVVLLVFGIWRFNFKGR